MHSAMRSAGMSKRTRVLDKGETRESEAEFETLRATISIAVAEVLGRLDDSPKLASCVHVVLGGSIRQLVHPGPCFAQSLAAFPLYVAHSESILEGRSG